MATWPETISCIPDDPNIVLATQTKIWLVYAMTLVLAFFLGVGLLGRTYFAHITITACHTEFLQDYCTALRTFCTNVDDPIVKTACRIAIGRCRQRLREVESCQKLVSSGVVASRFQLACCVGTPNAAPN